MKVSALMDPCSWLEDPRLMKDALKYVLMVFGGVSALVMAIDGVHFLHLLCAAN